MEEYLRDFESGMANLTGKDFEALGKYLAESNAPSVGDAGESLQDFGRRIVAMGSEDADKSGLAYNVGQEVPILGATMLASQLLSNAAGLNSLRPYSPIGMAVVEGLKNLPYGVISGLSKAYANDDGDNAGSYTLADTMTSIGAGPLSKLGLSPTKMAAYANMAGLDDYIRKKIGDD